jgi:hypothetical protein
MHKAQKGKKTNKKNKRGFSARDDIPLRARHTYCTASCSLPEVSDSTVVRTLGHGTIASQASADTKVALYFSLSQAGVSSGYWDQYKILAVRVTIAPDQNAIGLYTNSTTIFNPLYCVLDFDDTAVLSSVANAEAYSNCVVLNAGESTDRLFRPRMALSAYSGSFGGFANVADTWIDASSSTVQHYGMKIFVPGVAAAQTLLPSWQYSVEYFIAFRKAI